MLTPQHALSAQGTQARPFVCWVSPPEYDERKRQYDWVIRHCPPPMEEGAGLEDVAAAEGSVVSDGEPGARET